MKWKTTVMVLFILFAATCLNRGKGFGQALGNKFNTETPTEKVTQNKVDEFPQERMSNSDIDNLIKSFTFPPMTTDDLNFEENCPGLPIEIINQIKEAVYQGNSDSLIHELNDKSLMITSNDFDFKPNESEDIDLSEKDFNDAIQNGASNFLIYKCDINGDGTDEIIMIENLKYDYSDSNHIYILKKSGDKYVYAGYDYLGYYRCFALFKHHDKFYLIANYDDYKTKTTKALGLFALDGDTRDFMWLSNSHYTYIRKTSNGSKYHLLYKNKNLPIVSDIEKYVNEIGTDLIYTDRTHKTFYGSETERNDLFEAVSDTDTQLTSWCPTDYYPTQQWFKTIADKTVAFSLYRKKSEDIYLLDARINKNGESTILVDYMINLDTNVELSDFWDYEDTNSMKIEYKDPDIEKAFPKDIDERGKLLAAKIRGDFVSVNYKDKNIPNSLIVLLEKGLFNRSFDNVNLKSSDFEISTDDFYNKFGQYTYYDTKKDFDRLISHIYKYKLDKNTYYLTIADSGGSARFVDISIYKESDGELNLMDGWVSLDLDGKVIEYNNNLYFIETSYNYYSKYTDTIHIYKLVPDKIKDFVTIELKPNQFEWEEVYNNHQPYVKDITSYVDRIKDDLLEKSPIDDTIQIYSGDEKNKFDHDKKLRLKSVGGDGDYYEIDFNNDGEPEYFERHFWFPSNDTTLHLINNFYKFTNKRTLSFNSNFNKQNSALIQLWFKEIQGKVFTFRLFLNDGCNYFLNVSLVEDTNITQVQSYLIVPKNEFNVSIQESETSN